MRSRPALTDHASRRGRPLPRLSLATLAGLFVVWSVAWSTPAGRIGEDTKNDLYVDAWGLMRRALHLWDPQVTWGMLQNQGYGYLFPMGPFFALGSAVAPVWIVQRLWWSALLTAGYLGSLALLRALDLGGGQRHTPAVWAHLGALAYTLAPRVLSTMGAISPEAQAQLLAPLILLPLVRATAGRIPPRRAAAWSALAVLGCGGVNATATVFAAAPAGLWLISRSRWWRAGLTWWWIALVLAASAWWLGPLLVLGRYSPPFLGWIETAAMVTGPVGLLDVVKGTTHWLGHLIVPGGAWWPAGWAIASDPAIVVASALLGGLGLAGLALPSRHRRFLLLCLGVGLAFVAIPHTGPLGSPLSSTAQHLLDGPLAPFRNVHKADPLIRLPLVVGLVRLGASANGLALRRWSILTRPLRFVVGLAILLVAAPAMSGSLATRGTFAAMPGYWVQAGAWLDAHAGGGGALLLPSSSFGEYTWGRTIDEPLRALTSAPYAVRDAVPLTPAGTIRFLDEIERRAQTGGDLQGATAALRSVGIGYVVLRNDLDTDVTGGPPVAVARSALLSTPTVRRVAAFGSPVADATGSPVAPVEIFALDGGATTPLTLIPAPALPVVSGASEALPTLRDAGLVAGPVVFDGDVPAADASAADANANARIETDTLRARHRFFGATRGQDASRGLTAAEARTAPDYLPWSDPRLRSVTAYGQIAGVSATSALSDTNSLAGIRPADRPYAALDGDPRTAWLTDHQAHPALTVRFTASRGVGRLVVTPAAGGLWDVRGGGGTDPNPGVARGCLGGHDARPREPPSDRRRAPRHRSRPAHRDPRDDLGRPRRGDDWSGRGRDRRPRPDGVRRHPRPADRRHHRGDRPRPGPVRVRRVRLHGLGTRLPPRRPRPGRRGDRNPAARRHPGDAGDVCRGRPPPGRPPPRLPPPVQARGRGDHEQPANDRAGHRAGGARRRRSRDGVEPGGHRLPPHDHPRRPPTAAPRRPHGGRAWRLGPAKCGPDRRGRP
ncbi:MAG: DUF3367 domain-containing protein [Tetrasphaera sp.]|nr:DUF3367 domain-containing protein [Tetrasphaera sp.]